jgi:hypothetical protein
MAEWIENGHVQTLTVGRLRAVVAHYGDGALYVYCRAKRNAQRLIPKTFEGHAVKYVLCKVMP